MALEKLTFGYHGPPQQVVSPSPGNSDGGTRNVFFNEAKAGKGVSGYPWGSKTIS